MKKLIKEFQEFINQGNVMDMAVGIIIGGAFTSIVNALITSIITPLISLVGGGETEVGGMAIALPNGQVVDFGAFIGAVINFLIIALVVFFMVKAVNESKNLAAAAASKLGASTDDEGEPVLRVCPYCTEVVPDDATRCSHCGSILPNATAEDIAAMNGEKPAEKAADEDAK